MIKAALKIALGFVVAQGMAKQLSTPIYLVAVLVISIAAVACGSEVFEQSGGGDRWGLLLSDTWTIDTDRNPPIVGPTWGVHYATGEVALQESLDAVGFGNATIPQVDFDTEMVFWVDLAFNRDCSNAIVNDVRIDGNAITVDQAGGVGDCRIAPHFQRVYFVIDKSDLPPAPFEARVGDRVTIIE